VEGEIINKLHEVGFDYDAIIINAGAYTHTSVSIHDAIGAIKTPVAEVHISNVYAREEFRHKSIITSKCVGIISGFGMESYALAIQYFISKTI
jgi:3-dehydroquinate dehydratase-2